MGLPSYVINFDELVAALKDYLQNGIKVDISSISMSTSNVESLLNDISNKIQGVNYNNLITALNDLGVKIEGLGSTIGVSGTQKIYGRMLKIPIGAGKNSINFSVPSNGRLTDVTYSLSSWNFEDSWNLFINDDVLLFSQVTTKEYGENKHFENFYPVKSGDVITFEYCNQGSSAHILWVDFAILEDS